MEAGGQQPSNIVYIIVIPAPGSRHIQLSSPLKLRAREIEREIESKETREALGTATFLAPFVQRSPFHLTVDWVSGLRSTGKSLTTESGRKKKKKATPCVRLFERENLSPSVQV